jgi:hypothetical protein
LFIINDPVGTYPGIFPKYNASVVLVYLVLPLCGLAVLVYFIWAAMNRKGSITTQFILIAFIAIVALFISQRAVQRHSLMEGFILPNNYFPLLACSIPLLWYRSKKLISVIVLALILIFYVSSGFIVAHYPISTVQKDFSNNFFEFKKWENHEPRINIQLGEISVVSNLTLYLNDHLHGNETYFDMTNLLMPYTLLRKDYVPNSMSNMLQAGEWYQNETVRRLIQNKDRIPIVVTGGWQIDDVPNEMRTYRIAEYVYKNYRPIGHIDNYDSVKHIATYEIWLRNDLSPNQIDSFNNKSYMIPVSTASLMMYDIQNKNQNGTNIQLTGSNDPYAFIFIFKDPPAELLDSINTGLHLVYTSKTTGSLKIVYSVNNTPHSEEHTFVESVNKTNTDQDVYATLPENIRYITNIRIESPDNSNMTLKRAYLYPQNYSLIPDKSINRGFNLKKLPYIWGTFDAADPVSHQPVQSVLFNGVMPSDSGNPVRFINISHDLDKTSGNYILIKIKSASAGEIKIEYGNSDDFSGKLATMTFETIPSDETQNYLLRISSQWNWYAQPVTYLSLTPTTPITIYDVKILKGD